MSQSMIPKRVSRNGERGVGRVGRAGIYVLRGPLFSVNILAVVYFVRQRFAANIGKPDGLN